MANTGAENYIEAFYDSFGNSVSRGVGVMIPASVVEYDRNTHNIRVQPLVALKDGDKFVRDGIVSCTAWRPYAGRFLIDMPLEVGDTGWILAADSDTEYVKENCVHDEIGKSPSVMNPKTDWIHLMQHGIFFPDRWGPKYMTDDKHITLFNEGEIDSGRLVVQSADGQQKISIGAAGGELSIRVNAYDNIYMETDNDNSQITITAHNGTVTVNAKTVNLYSTDIYMKGNVEIEGPVHATGKITSDADVGTASVTSFNGHVHPESGGGTTSAPVVG